MYLLLSPALLPSLKQAVTSLTHSISHVHDRHAYISTAISRLETKAQNFVDTFNNNKCLPWLRINMKT